MKRVLLFSGFLGCATLLSSGAVLAQNTSWLKSVVSETLYVIPIFLSLCLALAVMFFVWGLVQFIQIAGEKTKEEGRQKMVWGITALFVIVSVWGLVALLQQITDVRGGHAPASPQIKY